MSQHKEESGVGVTGDPLCPPVEVGMTLCKMVNEVGCKEGEGAGSRRNGVRAPRVGTLWADTGRQEQVWMDQEYEGALHADLEGQGAGEREDMGEGETKQDGSFSEESMCFVGVFPPEPGLKRAGRLRTLGEGPRRSYTHDVSAVRGCSTLVPICVDTS